MLSTEISATRIRIRQRIKDRRFKEYVVYDESCDCFFTKHKKIADALDKARQKGRMVKLKYRVRLGKAWIVSVEKTSKLAQKER